MCALRLLINLDGAEKRLQETAKQFEKCGLSFERVPAVDMRGKTSEELEQHQADNIHVRSVGVRLSAGAIGCFLSHRQAWRNIVNSGERGGFVFEDDVFLSEYCRIFCSDDAWIPREVDLCQLSHMPPKDGKPGKYKASPPMPVGKKQGDFSLVKFYAPTPWGTQAYWISAQAAKFALSDTAHERFNRPVDGYLFEDLATSLFVRKRKVFSLSPAIVWESGCHTSQITLGTGGGVNSV